jgi:hypothetical protein
VLLSLHVNKHLLKDNNHNYYYYYYYYYYYRYSISALRNFTLALHDFFYVTSTTEFPLPPHCPDAPRITVFAALVHCTYSWV